MSFAMSFSTVGPGLPKTVVDGNTLQRLITWLLQADVSAYSPCIFESRVRDEVILPQCETTAYYWSVRIFDKYLGGQGAERIP
jgi:hypothetical protein